MVRLKNRYIVIEINPQNLINNPSSSQNFKLTDKILNIIIQNKVEQFHGDFGVAAIRSGFQAKYCNELTRIAIIRCHHGPHKLITSVLPFITDFNLYNAYRTTKVAINILYVGATIKKCFNFVKTHQENRYNEFCLRLESVEAKEFMRKALLDYDTILKALKY